jgi:signal peptidase II
LERFILVILATIVGVILVVVDQLLKLWAYNSLSLDATIPIIPNFFSLTYVENAGAAWGMFKGATWFLVLMPVVVIVLAIAYLIYKKVNKGLLLWASTLIISGGVGNLIDRVNLFGRNPLLIENERFVIDYIQVHLFDFPVFNFADCCVTIGAVLLFVYIIFFESKKEKSGGSNV